MAIVGAALLASVAAGCGRSPASAVATTTSARGVGLLAFSRCMRSDGAPGFPDPATDGVIPKKSAQQLGISNARYDAAQSACRHLLPGGGRPPDQAELQQVRATALRYSRCVRAHGVANFPEPGGDGRIPDPAGVGIDQGSPRFEAANSACGKDRPPYMPSNAAYNAYARAHG